MKCVFMLNKSRLELFIPISHEDLSFVALFQTPLQLPRIKILEVNEMITFQRSIQLKVMVIYILQETRVIKCVLNKCTIFVRGFRISAFVTK
jgi:hypothetical protein